MTFYMPTIPEIKATAYIIAGLLLAAYKKEALDYSKELLTKLKVRFMRPSEVARILDEQTKAVLKVGMDGLDSAVWLLLNEYKAQRVTVTKYVNKDGTISATCVSQALDTGMPSVIRDLQDFAVDSSLWDEIERIHRLPGRRLYVPDAQLVDIAAMRDALLNTGVWSGYYQSLPTLKGQPWAMLAVSWNRAHPVSPELMEHLHSSGMVCGTVLLIMEQAKEKSKSPPK